MFRFKSGIKVGYIRQGYIYFVSLLYGELDKERRRVIDSLCRECGGEYWRALREFVTTKTSATKICDEYFLSESTLHRAVRRYYEGFPKWL